MRRSTNFFFALLLTMAFFLPAASQDKFEIRSSEYSVAEQNFAQTYLAENRIAKWEETFADTTIPNDWQIIDNDGSGAAWEFRQLISFTSGTTVIPEAGQSFFFSSFNNANSNGLIDEWLITPKLPLVESGDSLVFYAGAIGGSFDDSLKVLVSTTDDQPASFTNEVAYFRVDGPVGAWNRYAFDMSAFDGQEVYVAIQYYIVDGGPFGTHSDNVWIDHFSLETKAPPTARLQVIHNAADPAAAAVDIYLNDGLLLDDFAFRAATPYIDAPAGVALNIGVAPGSSSSAADTLVNFVVTLDSGETYAAVANGVLNPNNFASNPDGRSTAFTLFIKTMAQEASIAAGNVEFAVVHGSSDAPAVDVTARGVATLVNNAAYGDITDYISVPPANYTLDVTDSTGAVNVASFAADLSGLADGAAVVFASGFLNPAGNQNGEAFGVFAALPDGNVVEFPAISTARLQVIHNAADPAAASVDIYLDDALLLDDFAFRAATPYIDAPAGVPINVGIAPGTSSSAADTLANFTLTLAPGETYAAIANGVLDPNSFAANPDGRSTAFTLFIKPMAQEASATAGNVEFAAVHGATDAPAVDVTARGVATLINNATYGDITNYIAVPPASYTLDVTDSTGTVAVATFAADLSTLADGAAIVFASGFLDPAGNQNGEAFGIFAALADGTVIELPAITTARLQVIHNAADPAAASVDVYLNDGLLLDDFGFRTATPFIDAPAGTVINVGVAGGSSGSAADTLKNFALTLTPGESYVAVANGVLDPNSFAANPDGRSTAFTLFINAMGQEISATSGNTEFAVLHGASDAPTVDVNAVNVATLVDDAAYGDFTGYISVPSNDYTLDVTDASGTTVVASYVAPLSAFPDSALVVFASGFLTPANNQNGPAFGLYVATPGGAVVGLTVTAIEPVANAGRIVNYALEQNYPNPFNPSTTITYALPQSDEVTLKIFNVVGQEIATLINGQRQEAGKYRINFDATQFASGVYFYAIQTSNYQATRRMILMK